MVKLEGLTKEEIQEKENRRIAEVSLREFCQLEKKFREIAEDIFNTPSLFGFFGRTAVYPDGFGDSRGFEYYVTIHPWKNSPYISAAIETKSIKLEGTGFNHKHIHDPSKNRISIENIKRR